MTDNASTITLMPQLAAGEKPRQLFILLHGVGANAANLVPAARHFMDAFPQAVVLVPNGFEAFDAAPMADARQWFSILGVTEENRTQRAQAAMPKLVEWIKAQQTHYGLVQSDTALVGFSQGAIMALESTKTHDGLAGRVLAFSGRYASLPTTAPELTTLHLLHGQEDPVMPYGLAVQAYEHLQSLRGDATIDIASGVGHEMHPSLIAQAIHRLRTTVPLRHWKNAQA
jgi:phospholipase/carboxylesterase